MKLEKNDITKKLLEAAAADLNEAVLDPKSAILTGNGIKKDAIQRDVLEVAEMLIGEDIPGLNPRTIRVLETLGAELPNGEIVEDFLGKDDERDDAAVVDEIGSVPDDGQNGIEKENRKAGGGVGNFVRAGLQDGLFEGMSHKEIAKLAVDKFDGNTTPACIGWYKAQLRRQGVKIKA